MTKKQKFISDIITTLAFDILLTILTHLINYGKIIGSKFVGELVLGLIIGYIVTITVPSEKWGYNLALKMDIKPESLGFILISGAVISVVFVSCMATMLTLVGSCLIGGAPVKSAMTGVVKVIWIYYLSAYLFGLIVTKPIKNLAKLIV